MKIKEITWQSGNDFYAKMVCEFCNHEQDMKHGYHDSFFHQQVIPAMECGACHKCSAPPEPPKP